jgi:6-phosphofructokinase 1
LKTIGVATCGGDAPGMNAAIRAVVRIAHSNNFKVLGFENGWGGLLTNTYRRLTPRSVDGILHLGGTILFTERCPEFKKVEGIKKAAETLALNNVDGLVVIGGDGSFRGALELSRETGTLIVGIPASIDNDVYGTDETIGFDTAVNTAVTEIDKIRDTAVSLDKVFIVEVMGRARGFLAINVGVSVGAEMILVPEVKYDNEEILGTIKEVKRRGKRSCIIVVAEGYGDNYKLADEVRKNTGLKVSLNVLGFTQRGGNPSARSRLLAGLFADKAVELICEEQRSRVVGWRGGNITSIDLEESCKMEKPLNLSLLKLAKVLSI